MRLKECSSKGEEDVKEWNFPVIKGDGVPM